jgi:outer membrane protein assembly factor BamB
LADSSQIAAQLRKFFSIVLPYRSTRSMKLNFFFSAALLGCLAVSPLRGNQADTLTTIAESPIKGGLCVIVGPSDAGTVAAIANSGSWSVHWLSQEPVSAAQDAWHAAKLSGRVTGERWPMEAAHLPFMDNLVSLLVVTDAGGIPEKEFTRVLRPGGELLIRDGAAWKRQIKPRPVTIDEWSQWRHGPDRNAVSSDLTVDVPKRVQWLFSPSVVLEAADMETADGRVFIQDRDMLLARDGFNGLPLWSVKLFPSKELGIRKPPALVVARGERVFGLMADGKLRALDAATGEPVLEFADAGKPDTVMLLEDGKLIVADGEALRCYDSATAKLLWRESVAKARTIVAGGGAVYYIVGNDEEGAKTGVLHARDAASGELRWKKEHEWACRTELASYGEDRIVFEMRRPADWRRTWSDPEHRKVEDFQLAVVNAKTGEEEKRLFKVATSARHGEFTTAFWFKGQLLTEARTPEGFGIALYRPGEFEKPAEVFQSNFAGDRGWGHCYPPVLTEKYYINGQLHFTDLYSRTQSSNVITRGACHVLRSGYVPANGMIYTFPKHCVCFPMLNGNIALASETAPAPEESHPLERGPAFGKHSDAPAGADEWPMFRRDEYRSAGADVPAPAALEVLWSQEIEGPDYKKGLAAEWADNPWTAGPLSAPVISQGRVFVAQSDTHRLLALDAATGEERWHFTAGGRIDGPPALHAGLALFGCRDGWLYAVNVADGALAWRRRIAPDDRRISTYGQIESTTPCAGAVLMSRGLAYVSAGLHPNSDGGLRIACVRPADGELLWIQPMTDLGMVAPWPEPFDPRPRDRPGIVSDPWRTIRPSEYRHFDLPVRDGDGIAVSRAVFEPLTGKLDLRKTSGFYQTSSGAKMPRTSWRYTDVQFRSPLVASLGRAVFSTSPRKATLFRADFTPGASFDDNWVEVTHEQFKAGETHAVTKLLLPGMAKWTAPLKGESESYPRALIALRDRLLYAAPDGKLTLRDIADGKTVLEKKFDPLAWDGAAATPGRVYVTTTSGRIACLGAK